MSSGQKPRFLAAGDEVMSEKWPQAIFLINQRAGRDLNVLPQ
jgi:hypothetical protein